MTQYLTLCYQFTQQIQKAVNNTISCSPSSVLTNLHLGATKPGRKFTISSINSKTLQPTHSLTAFSLNHYPMTLLPKSYLDMSSYSLPLNHRSDINLLIN